MNDRAEGNPSTLYQPKPQTVWPCMHCQACLQLIISCCRYQQRLQQNLMYLAAVADAQQHQQHPQQAPGQQQTAPQAQT